MDEAASDSVDEKLVVYLELYGVFEGLVVVFQHVVEAIGLSDCSWEAIKDESDKHKLLLLRTIHVDCSYPF